MEQRTEHRIPNAADVEAIVDLPTLRSALDSLMAAWESDIENAHGTDDGIRARVLRLIADGHADGPAMAREVLVTEPRTRWYA